MAESSSEKTATNSDPAAPGHGGERDQEDGLELKASPPPPLSQSNSSNRSNASGRKPLFGT
jgi:hypothetical protein